MTSSNCWQSLLCGILLFNASTSKVCQGAPGLPQDAGPMALDHSEFASSASNISWDAGAPLTRVETIVWELPNGLPVRESSVGGINASLAAEELARWNIGGNGDPTYVSNRIGYHPATRVIVDAEAGRTHRTRIEKNPLFRRYLAEIRNRGYWPYRICFESSAREGHSKGGDVWIQVRINKQGRVAAAKLLRASIDHKQIAQCILNETRSIRIVRTQPTGAILNLRIRVFPGDAPLPAPRKLPENNGVIEQGRLREALCSVETAIELCVRDGHTRDPRLWGRLATLLQFSKQGQVIRSEEYDSHFPDASVVKCADLAYRELRLAPLAEQTSVVVSLRIGALPTLLGESSTEPLAPKNAPPILSNQ